MKTACQAIGPGRDRASLPQCFGPHTCASHRPQPQQRNFRIGPVGDRKTSQTNNRVTKGFVEGLAGFNKIGTRLIQNKCFPKMGTPSIFVWRTYLPLIKPSQAGIKTARLTQVRLHPQTVPLFRDWQPYAKGSSRRCGPHCPFFLQRC